MKNPCIRECPEREMGCHAKCPRRKEYKAFLDSKAVEKRKEQILNTYSSASAQRRQSAREHSKRAHWSSSMR